MKSDIGRRMIPPASAVVPFSMCSTRAFKMPCRSEWSINRDSMMRRETGRTSARRPVVNPGAAGGQSWPVRVPSPRPSVDDRKPPADRVFGALRSAVELCRITQPYRMKYVLSIKLRVAIINFPFIGSEEISHLGCRIRWIGPLCWRSQKSGRRCADARMGNGRLVAVRKCRFDRGSRYRGGRRDLITSRLSSGTSPSCRSRERLCCTWLTSFQAM